MKRLVVILGCALFAAGAVAQDVQPHVSVPVLRYSSAPTIRTEVGCEPKLVKLCGPLGASRTPDLHDVESQHRSVAFSNRIAANPSRSLAAPQSQPSMPSPLMAPGTPLPSIRSFDPLCGTGTHDCSAAIDAAVRAGKGVDLGCSLIFDSNSTWRPSEGPWREIATSGFVITGCGKTTWQPDAYQGSGTLVITKAASKPFLQIKAGTNFFKAASFTLSRHGARVSSGADGIAFSGATEGAQLEDLLLFGHWRGLLLSSTSASYIENVEIHDSATNAIEQSNTATQSSSQWNMQHVIVQKSGKWGYYVSSSPGAKGLILGQLTDLETFANTAGGISLTGQSEAPIFDFRCVSCFLGSDGAGGELNVIWGNHIDLIGSFVERAGQDPTGPGLSKSADGAANNITLDQNTVNVQIASSDINGASGIGILSFAKNVVLQSDYIVDNGISKLFEMRSGILNGPGGSMTIQSVWSGNQSGNGQDYGVTNKGDIPYVCGLTGTANAIASFSGTSPNQICQNFTQRTTVAGLKTLDPMPFIGDQAIVGDARAPCVPGTVPSGGGSISCFVRWDGAHWVA